MRAAVTAAVAALTPYGAADWTAHRAHDLEFSCRDTLVHVAESLLGYGCQVAGGSVSPRRPAFRLAPRRDADPAELLAGLTTYGVLLATVVEAADPASRAYHGYGVSDPAGFAAMGALETVVHCYDIVAGFGGAWLPPRDIAAVCLDRLFHAEEASLTAFGPADALLWCCGRVALPGRPRRDERWRWDGRPAVDRMAGAPPGES